MDLDTRVVEWPTVLGLVSWLRTQDPATQYDYCDPFDCLVARYLRGAGHVDPWADPDYWTSGTNRLARKINLLPEGLNKISFGYGYPLTEGRWTYGAALARAVTFLAKGIVS